MKQVLLYEKAYFKVEDVEAYDEVKENLQKVDINWEQYDLIDNNGNSETMSSNFNDLAKVSEMMILVISVASFVILVLVFLFWLKKSSAGSRHFLISRCSEIQNYRADLE